MRTFLLWDITNGLKIYSVNAFNKQEAINSFEVFMNQFRTKSHQIKDITYVGNNPFVATFSRADGKTEIYEMEELDTETLGVNLTVER